MFLTMLVAGCSAYANPSLESLNEQATMADVRTVGEADLESRDWNVPGWYRRSIHVSPEIRSWLLSKGRTGSYTFYYTGLIAAIGLFIVMFFIYAAFVEGFRFEYFWVVTGLSVTAIPVFSFASSALSGQGVPWHFSMFCVVMLGAIAPPLISAGRGLPAFAASIFNPVAEASRRRADDAEQRRRKRAQEQADRQARAEQMQREKQRSKSTKEASVHEKLRNVELAVGELHLCSADEKAAMERALLHTVMELTGYEKLIRADEDAMYNVRNVILMLDRLGYSRDQIFYLKLVSIVR